MKAEDCERAWRVSAKDRAHFEQYVYPDPNSGCHIWAGAESSRGYGRIQIGCIDGRSRTVYAHRFAWEIANGPIPPGILVLHKCDVRCCVNVDHLFLGTAADN